MAKHRQHFAVHSRISIIMLLTIVSNRGSISHFHTHICLLRVEHLSTIRTLVLVVIKLYPSALVNMMLLIMWTHQLTLQQCHGIIFCLCNISGNKFNIGIACSPHRLHSFFDPQSSSFAALIWAFGIFYGRWQPLAIWPYFPQL